MRTTFRLLLCMTSLAFITGCSLDEPTWVNPARVEIHEEGFKDNFDTSKLDQNTLHAIAANYYRYGNGPMDVVVSYDPQSKTNNKAKAEQETKRIGNYLQTNGVRGLRITPTPVTSSGERSSTVVSFPALTAKPPESCGLMPGYTDAQTVVPSDAEGEAHGYQIGCTIEAMIAKQVVRPGDLLGRPGFETNADALRQETVIWKRGYYSERSNAPLQGQGISDVGASN